MSASPSKPVWTNSLSLSSSPNYVSSILAKMHMSRRAEAAAYLAEHRARQQADFE